MDEDILARVFRALRTEGVRYALFGGLAVAAEGLPAQDQFDVARLRERFAVEDL